MLTPKLEEWILCGKAFFKTFVAGGNKHTLTFGNDRFIIITDITYFPMDIQTVDEESFYSNQNTQVAIYGERGYNNYIFRNYNLAAISGGGFMQDFTGPTTVNTYLLHEQQVGFSFCNAPFFTNVFTGQAPVDNPSYAPPIEYGKTGDPGVIDTILSADDFSGTIQQNFTTRPGIGNVESQQLLFPFSAATSFDIADSFEYPLLVVNYVEVLGNANNIQI